VSVISERKPLLPRLTPRQLRWRQKARDRKVKAAKGSRQPRQASPKIEEKKETEP